MGDLHAGGPCGREAQAERHEPLSNHLLGVQAQLAEPGQHMMGARGKRSTETLLYFILMLWTMAFSTVEFSTMPDRPLLVSSWASNLISPIPKVGCTAVPSLARLQALRNWFSVRYSTGCLGVVGSQSLPCCTPGKCLKMFSVHPLQPLDFVGQPPRACCHHPCRPA